MPLFRVRACCQHTDPNYYAFFFSNQSCRQIMVAVEALESNLYSQSMMAAVLSHFESLYPVGIYQDPNQPKIQKENHMYNGLFQLLPVLGAKHWNHKLCTSNRRIWFKHCFVKTFSYSQRLYNLSYRD